MGVVNFIVSLIQEPAVILGVIALVGLLVQRKTAGEVISGTLKTVLGLLVLQVGVSGLINALGPIQTFFETGLPSSGFTSYVIYDEGVVSAVQTANIAHIGTAIAWTMLFGFIIHILLARITPFRFIFLTGHVIWYTAGALAILFYSFGIPLWEVILLASLTQGVWMTLAPALAQPIMRLITKSNTIGFAHEQTSLNMLGAWVGKLIGNKEDSSEDLHFSEKFNFFRDVAISISLVMLLICIVAASLAVGQVGVAGFESKISNGQNWLVFAVLQALGFTAGVLVVLQGVRMIIGEIVPAFKGIAERVIPNAIPALDCPVIYPFAPNSLIIGLISGTIGQVAGMALLAAIQWPVPLPSMIAAFFASGAGAIFGNATGGKRGAIAGGFLWGFVGWIIFSFSYKFMVFGNLVPLFPAGEAIIGFSCPDIILIGIAFWGLVKLLGLQSSAGLVLLMTVIVLAATLAFAYVMHGRNKSTPAVAGSAVPK